MRFFIKAALAVVFGLWLLGKGWAQQPAGLDLENILYMDLKSGRVTIQLRPDLAPKHVERVKKLAREGFYDGIKWHRVITDFMAQSGDPTGTGKGGSSYPDLKAEFSGEPFRRGTVGAARARDPDSANSQFFINLKPTPHLNGKYTIWGQVIEGMDHVDALKKSEPGNPSGTVTNPDRIIKVVVAADARKSVQKQPVSIAVSPAQGDDVTFDTVDEASDDGAGDEKDGRPADTKNNPG